MQDPSDQEQPVKSGAERARLHRERKRTREIQAAVGVAKLVLGQGVGEQKRVIMEMLERAAEAGDLPGDYANLLDRAIGSLASRRLF